MQQNITIGKDILELISSAMYVNPLSIYREYIQNGIDAIDEAVDAGSLAINHGKVEVTVDYTSRSVVIKDNGIGISEKDFSKFMLSFGGSHKRGTTLRGFRGVGRLAALGYCQEVIFEAKSKNDTVVNKVVWDCRRLKAQLNNPDIEDLNDIISEVTQISTSESTEESSFFQVTLNKVVRIKNDLLLNESEIQKYISQVCPVPFSTEFTFAKSIHDILVNFPQTIQSYQVFLNNNAICRPFEDSFMVSEKTEDQFSNLEEVKLYNNDNELSAVGWILHHSYLGAINPSSPLRGLRARVGNIQIGSDNLFLEIFPEQRFNAWAVGEIHIVDPRIRPNGRRDAFEVSVHSSTLHNNLSPVGKSIAKNCREASSKRNQVKMLNLENERLQLQELLVVNDLIVTGKKEEVPLQVANSLSTLTKLSESNLLSEHQESKARELSSKYSEPLNLLTHCEENSVKLADPEKQIMEKVISVIWNNYSDKKSARRLIEKILISL